ncbi:hypothetical protein HIM_02741 [Hirsutella minnesotensis 3608]|nr:hypothetical protein HIM_02741 [Hirsutella minnesotensis 3608]
MSSTQPQQSSGKRKRTQDNGNDVTAELKSSAASGASSGPFTRSPLERSQLSLAGLSDADKDPTSEIESFPHRPFVDKDLNLDSVWTQDHESEEQAPEAVDKRGKREVTAGAAPGKPLDTLLRSVHQLLDEGNIARAEKVFSLILQQRPGSRPIDVRKHKIWAIGAEILMRSGEGSSGSQPSQRGESRALSDEDRGRNGRSPAASHDASASDIWGFSSNLGKVMAYYEALIQQFPYDHRYPNNVAAPDFQVAMLNCEVYHAYRDYTAAVSEIEEEAAQGPAWPAGNGAGGEDFEAQGDDESYADTADQRGQLRQQALVRMQEISRQMDGLLETPLYKKNNNFLRLRVTASLYLADLLAPRSHMSSGERGQAEKAQQSQRQVAIDALEMILQNGGELDQSTRSMLNAWSE